MRRSMRAKRWYSGGVISWRAYDGCTQRYHMARVGLAYGELSISLAKSGGSCAQLLGVSAAAAIERAQFSVPVGDLNP